MVVNPCSIYIMLSAQRLGIGNVVTFIIGLFFLFKASMYVMQCFCALHSGNETCSSKKNVKTTMRSILVSTHSPQKNWLSAMPRLAIWTKEGLFLGKLLDRYWQSSLAGFFPIIKLKYPDLHQEPPAFHSRYTLSSSSFYQFCSTIGFEVIDMRNESLLFATCQKFARKRRQETRSCSSKLDQMPFRYTGKNNARGDQRYFWFWSGG